MEKRYRISFLAILVLSSLPGCGLPVARVAPSSGPPPAEGPAGPATLQASFRGRVDLGNDRQRFEGTFALAAPDRLYVEIAGPLGGVRAVLAARGGRVLVLLPATREYMDEPATAATYEVLLGLRLGTPALLDLMRTGQPHSGDGAGSRRIPLAPDRDGVERALLVQRAGDRVSARVEGEGGAPSGFRSLELRLADESPIEPDRLTDALFSPDVPAGWARLRPGGTAGQLLQPR